MKIKIKINKLIHELNKIDKVIASNVALASLKGLYLKVEEDSITLIGSNGDLSIKSVLKPNEDIQVINVGSVLIPEKIFLEILKRQESSSNFVILEMINQELSIKSDLTMVKINVYDKETFPHIEFNIIGTEVVLNSDFINKINRKVGFAAADQDQRIVLNGLNLKINENQVIVTATNSYRLATYLQKIQTTKEINITFFAKILREIVLPNNIEVKFLIDENHMNISFENTILQIRLIDAIYPEIQQLIPTSFVASLEVDPQDFIRKIEFVTVVSGQSSTPIRLIKTLESLSIEAKRDQIGKSLITIKDDAWKGEFLKITFDARFMIQALRSFDSKKVIINFAGQFKSIVLKSNEESNLIQLVLPHRAY